MIDLHTHSIFSDGELIPAELIRRAVAMGYKAIAITDHMDQSNIDFIIPRIVKAVEKLKDHVPITVLPGAEITHVPPPLIPEIVKDARSLGAKIVVVHGETITEPVVEGTNRAAIEAGADLLAHPGIISQEDLMFAKETGITLEITARKGHSFSNGHVAKWALKLGIPLTINSDAHSPSDLITKDFARRILLSTGIEEEKLDDIFRHSKELVQKALRR
ncbi:MAG: histidinol phosphate phosphatase domain-containing protein [Nitrospirae bacterium]|nr:histidinol phosphate phosphatase domain-containing protein [Nitrospirota bacterium]